MKFIVSSGLLLKNLQKISGVIGTNTVLPILEDFLFDIKKGILHIRATDLETSISTEMSVDATEDCTLAIPAKMLLNILKELPEQPITIDLDASTFAVEITSDNGKYKLTGENGEDFPKPPVSDDVKSLSMAASLLFTGITKSLFAVSNDELRPAMNGVFFQVDEKGITFVATDAHKMVRIIGKEIDATESGSFIMPKKALNLLKNIVPMSDMQIKIDYNANNAFFEIENVSLICRFIEQRFPDYNAVIPKENQNMLIVNRQELLSSLRRTTIFSNKTTNQVLFKITGQELNISAQDLDFSNEANESLPCDYKGDDMDIAFNSKFLIDMLNNVDGEEVLFELSTPNRAGLIKPVVQEEPYNLMMLVMPVMINI